MKKLMGGRIRAGGGESAIDLAERVRRDPHAQRILAEARDPVCRALRKMVVPKPEVSTSEPKEVFLNLIAAGLCDRLGLTVAQLIEPQRAPCRQHGTAAYPWLQ
jgi:hypothetical protein